MSDRSPSRPAGSNHQERYVPAFDGVRAIAALMVFATHYLGWDAGTYGVNIFLVLSGLLITGVLLDASHHTHRFRNFYIRRSLRIFPLFYGVWLLLLLLTPWLHIEWNRRAVLYPLYLGNFIRLLVPDAASHAALLELVCVRPHLHAPSTRFLFVVSHLWSLCLEEQFYLVWPFVVYTVRSRRTLLRICCVSILLVPVVRVISLHLAPGDPLALWELTPLRFDEFLLGALGALLLRSSFRSRLLAAATPVFLVGAAILLVGFFVHRHLHGSAGTWTWRMTGDFAGVDLATFGLLLLGIRQESLVARALSLAPLRALGRISYGFYVFHLIPFFFYLRLGERLARRLPALGKLLPGSGLAAIVAFLATLLLASLSFRYLETPFLRLKNRLAPTQVPVRDLSPA